MVDVGRELLGADEWTTLRAQHQMGVALRLLGQFLEKAYEIDLDTLRKRRVRAARPSPGQPCTRSTPAPVTCVSPGLHPKALARQDLGVRTQIQVMGELHPQTLWAQHITSCCAGAGRAPRARTSVR